jgi:hypothetical protein
LTERRMGEEEAAAAAEEENVPAAAAGGIGPRFGRVDGNVSAHTYYAKRDSVQGSVFNARKGKFVFNDGGSGLAKSKKKGKQKGKTGGNRPPPLSEESSSDDGSDSAN